ncbi:orotidine-5'-phosphate decarboxylase [Criblamydia sequanensis]|uniref:Orotate phosphoribosyltransferase n=1 Tax=Candidatus Criblamydia sequanensis CRIB-18 TaxID=1437425 RepID=A0A090D061_9BACT|nr:orotidine-5'-phosphate decarboxylase [Criblamydia sequanensis]CDR33185.1 Uridine 5'-monophosphate synthase [Criblamydia sequanensis CRIB-18]
MSLEINLRENPSDFEFDNQDRLLEKVSLELHEMGAIQFGSFKLKNGSISPYYVDLRRAISYPKTLSQMCYLMWQKISNIPFDSLAGVPYAALSLCTGIALLKNLPMIMVRKEVKEHGTQQLIEGIYKENDTVILVEDVVTTGGSLIEVAKKLKEKGLIIKDAICFVDREESDLSELKEMGIKVHSVLNVSKIFSILNHERKLNTETITSSKENLKPLSYRERASLTKHSLAKDLFYLMDEKKTNLALAADVRSKNELLNLAETIGPYICVFKTHIDIVSDFDLELIKKLQLLAEKHRFILFEDRKFADIGNTSLMQYEGGIFKIASWAHLTNAHTLVGPDQIKALREGGKKNERGLLLIPELSSVQALTDESYAKKTIQMAEDFQDFVIGFIARKRLTLNPKFITMTPGVILGEGKDAFGQQYLNPKEVIQNRKSDIIIVGRGIYQSHDPINSAKQYRQEGWEAYQNRLF